MSNPSKEVMRRSVEGHLTELERMREFDRGYQAGRAAMSAEHGTLRQSCKNGENCKAEASESVESSKFAKNCKSGHSRTCPESNEEVSKSAQSVSITDELRKFVESEYSETIEWYQHPQTLIAIADRIDEQFTRICERQEAVLQSTIEDNVDYDDLYAAAAGFAGCDECGEYKQRMYQEFEKRVAVEQERDELRAECDRLTAALDELHADPANDVICRLERERDELQAKMDEIVEVLDGRD